MSWVNKLPFDGHDLMIAVGVGLIDYGVAQWSKPAAWICAGAVWLTCALVPSVNRLRRRR